MCAYGALCNIYGRLGPDERFVSVSFESSFSQCMSDVVRYILLVHGDRLDISNTYLLHT